MQVDLLPNPWTAESITLKRAQENAHQRLRPLGIFARPQGEWEDLPGLNWQSPTAADIKPAVR